MQNGDNQAISPQDPLSGLRVDLFITELYVGGAEKCLTDLALFLKKQGASVRVFSLGSLPASPNDILVNKIREAEIEVQGLGADRVWNAASATVKLRKLLRDSPPDVLHSFLFHANMIASAALVGLRGRIRTHAKQRICWVAGVRVADPRQQRLAMESLAFRRADRVVAVSEGSRQAYRKFCPIQSEQWSVIPNGVDIVSRSDGNVAWESFGLPPDAKVVLFVGRLDAQKGVRWLVETATDWLPQLPQHHLVIAGRGPQQDLLKEQMTHLEKERPDLKIRVHLVGWLDQPRRWMRQAEMLVLPAQYEGMPNVCLEAMAEELPVVAFDVEGIRELLGEPGAGQVVPVQDRDQWSKAILKLATDGAFHKSVGERNRHKIDNDFQLTHQLQKYVDLYRSLL